MSNLTRREYLEANRGTEGTQYIELTSDADSKVQNIELRIAGTLKYFQVGTVKKGDEGRQDCGGDMIAGPWAYAFGLGSCIAANRMSRTPHIDVSEGDVIVLDGTHYLLKIRRREFLSLEILHEDGTTTRNAGEW